jgi:FAD/FMN-containing dehydrogenase
MVKIGDVAKIVGKKRVMTDQEVLKEYKDDTSFVSGKMPLCVARPRNAEEVQKIVRLANEKRFALIPCSSQGPRTRGDTVPEVEGAVVVDLSGMDSIVRMDKRNKVAMIEPGVSFGALQEAAHKQGLRAAMPLAPRKRKSVVGSLLEREPTTMPKFHWDMSDPLCCVEVIFGTGDLFRTGAAAGPGTLEQQWASGQAQKSPMGPSQTDWAKVIQGAQGTMGIVTWASIKLELMPQIEKAFFVGAQDLAALVDFTFAIQRAKLPDHCLILDRVNLTAILGEDPSRDLPPWVLFYTVSGYEHFPEERVDYVEKDIEELARASGVVPGTRVNGVSAQKFLSLVNRPSDQPYWKNRPFGGFQDIFFLTTLDRAPAFVRVIEAEAGKHGLSKDRVGVYLQPIQQGRACHVEFTLMVDPFDPEQAGAVEEMWGAASRALSDAGAFFSRPYGPWSDLAYAKCPDTVAALKKVKGILDPTGVMNPGKLCF